MVNNAGAKGALKDLQVRIALLLTGAAFAADKSRHFEKQKILGPDTRTLRLPWPILMPLSPPSNSNVSVWHLMRRDLHKGTKRTHGGFTGAQKMRSLGTLLI